MSRKRNNISVLQNSIFKSQGIGQRTNSFYAVVSAVYTEKNTCDLDAWDGSQLSDIPVATKAGLINDEVYGVLDLPAKEDVVRVDFVKGIYVISDTIIPYLTNEFHSAQTPVNSSGKAYTLKLLEEGKDNTYRKIFKSGTTIEVQDNGTIIIETPSGTYLKVNEASSGDVTVEANGNTFSMQSGKVAINGSNLEVLQ